MEPHPFGVCVSTTEPRVKRSIPERTALRRTHQIRSRHWTLRETSPNRHVMPTLAAYRQVRHRLGDDRAPALRACLAVNRLRAYRRQRPRFRWRRWRCLRSRCQLQRKRRRFRRKRGKLRREWIDVRRRFHLLTYGSLARTKQSFASSSLRRPADFSAQSGKIASSIFASSATGREISRSGSGRCSYSKYFMIGFGMSFPSSLQRLAPIIAYTRVNDQHCLASLSNSLPRKPKDTPAPSLPKTLLRPRLACSPCRRSHCRPRAPSRSACRSL